MFMLESYKGKNNLLDINWYLSKMSMFLKESYGIIEELKWDVDLLNNINNVCDSIVKSFDIYSITFDKDESDSYENIMNQYDKEGKDFLTLDIIASLIGISRNVFIANSWVKLNNYDLWQYIIITIAKNNFKGTNEEIINAYNKAHIEIIYLTVDKAQCTIKVKMDNLSENIKNLFLRIDAPLCIQSMGIYYNLELFQGEAKGFILDKNNNLDNYSYRL